MLLIENLTKKYHKSNKGVENVNFHVKEGQFHILIGENGAGKTTIIKSILGAYTNFEGKIKIQGLDSLDSKSKENIGYVPEFTLFPKEISVYEYLKYFALLSKVDKKDIKSKITFFLEKMNILDLINEKPVNLSSGQKKKIILIQALLSNPKLIILDEPSANLDPSAKIELFNTLYELKQQGKTIFISSHMLKELDEYADSLTLISKGKIIYSGKKYDNLEKIYYEKIFDKK